MEKVRISDICIISNGFAFKSDKYVDNKGARVIRITNVQKGKIVDNDPKYYPFELLENLDNYKIFEGDIMMSLTGNVGRVGKFPSEMLPAYINQRICRIMPKDDRLDINYLFHFLNNDSFETEAMRNSSGAAQLNLSTRWLSGYEIPLPSLSEQKAIAEKLDKAQEIIRYNEEIIAKYDALTQSLFLEMFGDPVKNEKGWEETVLSNVCDNIVDCPHSTPKKVNYVSDYPCIRTSEIKNSEISWSSMQYLDEKEYEVRTNRLKPEAFDIIYAREGSYGDAVILPEGFKFSLGQRTMLFRANKSLINPIFLHRMVVSDYVYYQAKRKNSGSTVGHVNVKDIKLFNIFLPPITLQNQFAERVSVIEAQKQLAQESLAKSQELFHSLLKESFKN